MRKTSRQGMRGFESLQQPKFRTMEAAELVQVHGGYLATVITLSTVTVTPSGGGNDGDDSWSGEDGGGAPPREAPAPAPTTPR